MIPVLQSRWRLEGQTLVYYGLRQPPHLFHRRIWLDRRTAALVASLDGKRDISQYIRTPGFQKLLREGIVTDCSLLRTSPSSLEDAAYCVRCAANDYVIPGLELDSHGLCPMCRTEEKYRYAKNIMPVLRTIPRSPDRRYDAAVFYTGGKDSSYLLYQLARVQKLRVLSLTWETPFISDWARESIAHAREALPEVDFLVERAPTPSLNAIYRKAYALQKNVCICPSVAYVLFFQRLCQWDVPYLVLGNEPSQCRNLIYNQMAPAFYYHPLAQSAARLAVNTCRVFTLRRPFAPGQMELYMTVRQHAFRGESSGKKRNYHNELVENTASALAQAPDFLAPFRQAVREAARSARLPALIHIDFDDISEGGVYDWAGVKELLSREIGWVDATDSGKGLHTSCKIERCKEWSQLFRFRNMETCMLPFSAIELSLASAAGSVSRDRAIEELKRYSGFSSDLPPEWSIMLAELEKDIPKYM